LIQIIMYNGTTTVIILIMVTTGITFTGSKVLSALADTS